MSDQYRVEIFNDATGEVVKSLPCHSLRQAEKLEHGVIRNLNHNKFSTRIVPPAAAEIGKATASAGEGGKA